jgi:phage-related protein
LDIRRIGWFDRTDCGGIDPRRQGTKVTNLMPEYTKNLYTNKTKFDKLLGKKVAQVEWVGRSREEMMSLPESARANLGYALFQMEIGQDPPDSRRVSGAGSGVYELRDQDERAWYRVVYLKKIGTRILVLHCFEKQTNKIEKRDLEVIERRLKEARRMLRGDGDDDGDEGKDRRKS